MRKRETLSAKVASELRKQIETGTLPPGSKIPTESELCVLFNVSRTVVREAVTWLRSDGLLIPRQGIGVFVSEAPRPARFEIDGDTLRTLSETIELLEMRVAIEVEAAGLCAARASKAEIEDIRSIMESVDQHHSDPKSVSVHYDYDFHVAIAQGSHNAYLHRFQEFLGSRLVPRFQLSNLIASEFKDNYYDRIHGEHEAIMRAIEAHDDALARSEMRDHLINSLERLKGLAHSLGLAGADDKPSEERPLVQELAQALLRSGARSN